MSHYLAAIGWPLVVPSFLLTTNRRLLLPTNMNDGARLEVLQGTLDLLILKTLDALGAQHGYGIARRIEQLSADVLSLNQGTLYPALLRLEQQGFIESEWGVSDHNRRARFYCLTRRGRTRLAEEIGNWRRMTAAVDGVLGAVPIRT